MTPTTRGHQTRETTPTHGAASRATHHPVSGHPGAGYPMPEYRLPLTDRTWLGVVRS
ncbi:MAG: hypothetical protein GXX79_13465 [Actinomycetales bacterium]|nr:hypothetical protein [Actinomycetales bacterium]